MFVTRTAHSLKCTTSQKNCFTLVRVAEMVDIDNLFFFLFCGDCPFVLHSSVV